MTISLKLPLFSPFYLYEFYCWRKANPSHRFNPTNFIIREDFFNSKSDYSLSRHCR